MNQFMGIGDWGLGIGDLGVGPNSNTPIPISKYTTHRTLIFFKKNIKKLKFN